MHLDDRLSHGRSLLVVEDDIAVAQMYKMRLELDGYLVLTAAEGETVLSIAAKFIPDLMILDLGLPGMDGLALMEALRANDGLHEIPIVILTNSDDPDVQERSIALGAREFLVKSKTTPDDLPGCVQSWFLNIVSDAAEP